MEINAQVVENLMMLLVLKLSQRMTGLISYMLISQSQLSTSSSNSPPNKSKKPNEYARRQHPNHFTSPVWILFSIKVKQMEYQSNIRILQRNLVYLVGMPIDEADSTYLMSPQMFGKYGEVLKVVQSGSAVSYAANTTTSL